METVGPSSKMNCGLEKMRVEFRDQIKLFVLTNKWKQCIYMKCDQFTVIASWSQDGWASQSCCIFKFFPWQVTSVQFNLQHILDFGSVHHFQQILSYVGKTES